MLGSNPFIFTQTKLLRLTMIRGIQEVLESKEVLSLPTINKVNRFLHNLVDVLRYITLLLLINEYINQSTFKP